MAPCELFEEKKINAYEAHRRPTIFASCDFCFVYFLNQEQVRFFRCNSDEVWKSRNTFQYLILLMLRAWFDNDIFISFKMAKPQKFTVHAPL